MAYTQYLFFTYIYTIYTLYYIHFTSHLYAGDQAAGVGERIPEQDPGHTGGGAEAVPQVR